MLLMLVIAIDFGRLFFSYIQVSNAAREGANYAAAHAADATTGTAYTNGVTAAALGETDAQAQRGEGGLQVSAPTCFDPNAPIPAKVCQTATNSSGIGYQVSVTVTQPFTFFTPLIGGFFGGQLNISSSATATILNPVITGLVIPSPSATATATATGGCAMVAAIDSSESGSSGHFTFKGSSTGSPAPASWAWTFGDGLTSGVQNPPRHDYSGSGPYSVTLTVANGSCNNTASTSVTP
jgi:Flp pilus assembly protein TadG